LAGALFVYMILPDPDPPHIVVPDASACSSRCATGFDAVITFDNYLDASGHPSLIVVQHPWKFRRDYLEMLTRQFVYIWDYACPAFPPVHNRPLKPENEWDTFLKPMNVLFAFLLLNFFLFWRFMDITINL
jgi:hypothetical protein